MTIDEETAMQIVPPVDPFLLLRLDVKPGECVPFHVFLLWKYQTQTPANPRTLPA